jgi:predicted nucleic acid-binding protein
MIVADSSFLVEGLIGQIDLISDYDEILTLDLAIYEIMSSVWKHEFLLKDLTNGVDYLSVLTEMIRSMTLKVIQLDDIAMKRSYELASKHKKSVYDTAFIALALEMGLDLKTFDKEQLKIFNSEIGILKNSTKNTK